MTYEHWQTIFSIGVAVWIVFAYLMIMELRSTVKRQSHQIELLHGIAKRSHAWMELTDCDINELQERLKL